MKNLTNHIQFALLILVFLGVSCHKENPREVCDYKLLLRYDYNEENTATGNMIEYYVYTIDEYIFDDAEVLFAQRRISPERCREMMNSEWDLPPGRYSLIAVGNRDERSTTWDAATNLAPVVGQTRRDDMRLTLDNAEMFADGTSGDSERLYHGYRTFAVEERGISRVRVDMVNTHLKLRFRVTWRGNATPARGMDYHATLRVIPSEYRLMPQYFYPAGSFSCNPHDCDTDDLYPNVSNDVIHHIPYTCHGSNNVRRHRNNTKINADSEMWGEFTTYRTKLTESPKLGIYRSDDGELVIPKEIDLREYFEWYDYEVDYSLRQEYYIDIVIDGDRIFLMPLNVADWDEGGVL